MSDKIVTVLLTCLFVGFAGFEILAILGVIPIEYGIYMRAGNPFMKALAIIMVCVGIGAFIKCLEEEEGTYLWLCVVGWIFGPFVATLFHA